MSHSPDTARFMAKVEVTDTCWIWKAAKLPTGYGRFYFEGKLRYAHRVSMALFNGADVNSALETLHSCDNPACVNPKHVSFGTHAENMLEVKQKGRGRTTPKYGSDNHKTKLSEAQLAGVVGRLRAGELPSALAKEYGVTSSRIRQVGRAAGIKSPVSATEKARQSRLARTECRSGHPLSGENLKIHSNGARGCRICLRATQALYRKSKKGSI